MFCPDTVLVLGTWLRKAVLMLLLSYHHNRILHIHIIWPFFVIAAILTIEPS
jgi:hypothetical protein